MINWRWLFERKHKFALSNGEFIVLLIAIFGLILFPAIACSIDGCAN